MTRTSRTRDRTISMSGTGTTIRTYPGFGGAVQSTTTHGPFRNGYEVCDDYLSAPQVSNPLLLRRGRVQTCYASGRYQSGAYYYHNDGVPMNSNLHLVTTECFKYAGLPSRVSTAYLSQLAMANANPNSPDIDLPLALFELRELPSMLRHLGNLELDFLRRRGGTMPTVARATAGGFVSYQFGWRPLINDLLSMLEFSENVAKREAYLRKLAQDGGKRLRRKLLKENLVHRTSPLAWSVGIDNGANAKCDLTYEISRSYWYSARANLLNAIPARDLEVAAARATLGLTSLSIETVWNSLPWTWLIDWFASTGALLGAYRGGIPWKFKDLNIMCKSDVSISGTFRGHQKTITIVPPSLSGNAVELYRQPTAVFPFPVLREQYLSLRQLGILLSLATIKAQGANFAVRL